MYFNILLKYTDGFHSQDTKNLGMKNSPEKNPILVIVYLSIPTDGPTTYVSEEEKAQKIKTGRKKATASRAVQCRMLGFSTPYEVTDSTGSIVWVKNTFTCYNLESKHIMCRHDCFWNCSTPGALSDVIATTSNDTDLVTTSEEEFDYTLIGMDTQPRTTPSKWKDNGGDPTKILSEI